MKKLLLATGAALLIAGSATAQDVHFTQYFTSPLTLNPALTGLVQCDVRAAANYRSQWASVSANPYITGTVSFDMATMKHKLREGDALGIGVLGMYDRSGLGALTNTTVGLSLAYHHAFGKDKLQTISFGMQTYLVQKSLDFNKLEFGDQIDPNSGITLGKSSEQFGSADISYADFNAGIMYSGHVSDHATAYAGVSYYHFTQPVETFLQGTSTIHSRQTAYLGGSFDLNQDIVLYASGLYQTQASATEIMLGAAAGFILNPGHDPEFQKNTILYLGGWYRYQDAVSPYVAFQYQKMQFGLSYDVNVSAFTPATNGAGAYEFTFIYNGCINHHEASPTYNFACPKF
jgi:type IX secretion system PorP/SprF family membrane protein